MLEEVEMHVLSMAFQDTNTIVPIVMFYYKTGYTRYIPGIYYAYTMRKSRASLLSCPSALGSLRPGLPSDLLSFSHR